MKKLLASLFILSFCLFSCTEKTLTDQIVPKRENSHYLSLETRSSIKMDELPDRYDFNVTLSDAEFVANKYSSENKLQELVPYEYDGYTLFYVANYDKGYKVISGDKRTSIFLLESDEGRFEFRDDGEFDGPSFWLDDLAYDILLLKKGEAKVTDASNVLFWNSIVGNDDLRIPNQLLIMSDLDSIDFDDPEHVWAIVPVSENDYYYSESIPHILTTKWGQQDPWNWNVPYCGAGYEADSHCRTGCSAVAMAQIIYYCHFNLNKPLWLYHGSKVIGTYNDPSDPISFIQGTYHSNSTHWDDMAVDTTGTRYDFEYDFVGQLMADVGNQIDMSYSPTRSEADITVSGFNHYGIYCDTGSYNSSTVIANLRSNKPVAVGAFAHISLFGLIQYDGHSWVIDGLSQAIRDHVITYEWRRLSELSSNNYPLYTEEQMMYIDPDVYSGKSFQETTRYSQYYYRMNWGADGMDDDILYGINGSDAWEHNGANYHHNKEIWYKFQ